MRASVCGLCALLVVGCSLTDGEKAGPEVRKTFEIPPGTQSLVIRGAFSASVKCGPATAGEMKGAADILSRISVHVEHNQLTIAPEEGIFSYRGPMPTISLQMPLREVRLDGASRAEIACEGGRLGMILDGASQASLTGSLNTLHADLHGSSSLHGFDMTVEHVVLNATGASHAELDVQRTMQPQLSGASSLTLRGPGQLIQPQLAGASTINRLPLPLTPVQGTTP